MIITEKSKRKSRKTPARKIEKKSKSGKSNSKVETKNKRKMNLTFLLLNIFAFCRTTEAISFRNFFIGNECQTNTFINNCCVEVCFKLTGRIWRHCTISERAQHIKRYMNRKCWISSWIFLLIFSCWLFAHLLWNVFCWPWILFYQNLKLFAKLFAALLNKSY